MEEMSRKKKYLNGIVAFVFILMPLISAILFCLKDGRLISDIYIPLGGWSDEITYYKQIEGILSHGLPRGYFGYNQSRALYGSLAVWGGFPLIPYVIWGFLFGWNYCSPVYANIFFCVTALFVFYRLIRPKKAWMAAIAVFWIANPFLNRYILSGVIEASVIMQTVIIAVCGEYLLSEKVRTYRGREITPTKDKAILICCTAAICFLALARPYFAVFFLIPLWKSIKDKNKKGMVCLPFLAAGVIALFFLNSRYFCSTYFSSMVSFEKMRSEGISLLFRSMIEIAKFIWYAIRYKGVGPGWYYLLLAVELAVMACVCVKRKYCRKEVPPMFFIMLIGEVLIVLSIIMMYDLSVGARHILALIVANAILLAAEYQLVCVWALAVICVAAVIRTKGADALPYQNEEYVQYMDMLKEEFAKAVEVTDEISYDNVIGMPTADIDAQNPDRDVCTYYGVLYAMPSGVGISLDFQDFYDDPQNIKAKYIVVHPEGKIREILEEAGMSCVYENNELMLYCNKK